MSYNNNINNNIQALLASINNINKYLNKNEKNINNTENTDLEQWELHISSARTLFEEIENNIKDREDGNDTDTDEQNEGIKQNIFLDGERGLVFNQEEFLNKQMKDAIHSWLPDKCFVLKYKATRDGFSSFNFHEKCDGIGPTLTIILSSSFYIFGGYTSDSWSSPTSPSPFKFTLSSSSSSSSSSSLSSPYSVSIRHAYEYKSDPSTFIFTLSNPFSLPPTQYFLKKDNFNNITKYGILCQGIHGPLFGGGGYGCDISVYSNSNIHSKSHFCFPTSFVDTTGKGNKTFTGAPYFSTKEILVYCVV